MNAKQPPEQPSKAKWYEQYNFALEAKYLIGPGLLLLVSAILMLLEPYSSEYLAYQRQGIAQSELWRFFSANMVHTNLPHFLLNSLGLLFIWFIHGEHYDTGQYLKIFVVCGLFTGIGMHYFDPIDQYRGLSGALHGVIIYGAIKDIKCGLQFGWPLLLGIMIKVGYENVVGATQNISMLIEAEVAVRSHLFGMLGGIVMATPLVIRYIKEGVDEPIADKSTGNVNELEQKQQTDSKDKG